LANRKVGGKGAKLVRLDPVVISLRVLLYVADDILFQ